VGWTDAHDRSVTLVPSASESARFGHPVERLTVGAGWTESMSREQLGSRLRDLATGSTATTIILRYPAQANFVVTELGGVNREVYPAGSLLYWERDTAGQSADPAVSLLDQPLAPLVAAEALAVIADSFEGYVNHYHANPLIEETAVTEGYLEWAGNSLVADTGKVFVVRDGDEIAGVATIDASEPGYWEILLAGMATSAQGKGLYLRLVRGVLAAAAEVGVPRVLISTQTHNIAVQRAWAKLGFSPVAAVETVHLVSA